MILAVICYSKYLSPITALSTCKAKCFQQQQRQFDGSRKIWGLTSEVGGWGGGGGRGDAAIHMETLQMENLVELIEEKNSFNSQQAFDGHETRRITEDNEVTISKTLGVLHTDMEK